MDHFSANDTLPVKFTEIVNSRTFVVGLRYVFKQSLHSKGV